MSERNQSESVSQAVQELKAQVETWERKLAGWKTVISETLLDALEQGAARAEARAAGQAQKWAEAQERRMQPLLTTLASAGERQVSLGEALAKETHNLHVLTSWLEELHKGWMWGLSRSQWKGLVVMAVVSVVVGLGAAWLYQEFGPPEKERARLETERGGCGRENARWQELWANTSEGGKVAIQKRADEQRP